MFGWIDRIWHWGVRNVGDPVSSWVRDVVRGIFGWLSALFGHIGDAWMELWHSFVWWRDAFVAFAHEAWQALFRLFRITIPQLIRWAGKQLARLGNDIITVYRKLFAWVANLIKRIEAAIKFVTNWVITHVWNPLKKDFLTAWHWITHYGQILWFYITHPDKLAALIFNELLALLEKQAWTVGAKLGHFFLGLIVNNLKRFVLLLEDILMAVF